MEAQNQLDQLSPTATPEECSALRSVIERHLSDLRDVNAAVRQVLDVVP